MTIIWWDSLPLRSIEKTIKYPLSAKDSQGRLLCGAGVGITANVLDRVKELIAAKVDVVVLDSAHGHSENVLKCLRMIKEKYPDLQVIAGNVATGAGTKALIEAGADAVKVGDRPRFHLHDARGGRYRRAVQDYGDYARL